VSGEDWERKVKNEIKAVIRSQFIMIVAHHYKTLMTWTVFFCLFVFKWGWGLTFFGGTVFEFRALCLPSRHSAALGPGTGV
jgi:hypothetical protein